MTQKLANKARSTLTGAITNVATSLTIQSADADLFPVATTGTSAVGTGGLDWFKIVLEKSTGEYEIAYCRSRAAGVAILSNVIRGQEGTTAIAFSAGDVVGLRMTKTDIENALAGVFTGWSAVQVASAATVDIGAQTTPVVEITGTTGITSLGTNYTAGPRFLRFTGALTITHNATTLICPGGVNITTMADMTMIAVPKSTAGTADGWVIEAVTPASTEPTIAATVAANALTIALKTPGGADPASTAPLSISFRDSTITSGAISSVSQTAAQSLVVSSGSTLGTANSTPFRLWVVEFNDAGTLRLGVVNCLSSKSIMQLSNDLLYSSTAEGGAGAADSAQVIYTGTAVTSKAISIRGYLEWSSGLATAGTWSSGPTKIQSFGPGIPLPGQIVQRKHTETGAVSSVGSTAMPIDDTIPAVTEGNACLSLAITPTSACNILDRSALINYFTSTSSDNGCAMFQDSAGADAAVMFLGGQRQVISITGRVLAGTTSSTTTSVRAGSNAGTAGYLNGAAGPSRLLGGALLSWLHIDEVMT